MGRSPTLEEARVTAMEETSREIRASRRDRRNQQLRAMGFSEAAIRDGDIPAAYREQLDPYTHGLKPEDCHAPKAGRKRRAKTPKAWRFGSSSGEC
jgi:hypothetical protein